MNKTRKRDRENIQIIKVAMCLSVQVAAGKLLVARGEQAKGTIGEDLVKRESGGKLCHIWEQLS